MLEAQAATGLVEGTSGEGQSGVVASTALIEKILSEDPRWQGEICLSTRLQNEPKCHNTFIRHSSCCSLLISPHADSSFVLSHYKTELCKKPPRLCRQGYACPYYHNSKDRRRSPHKHKYRSEQLILHLIKKGFYSLSFYSKPVCCYFQLNTNR